MLGEELQEVIFVGVCLIRAFLELGVKGKELKEIKTKMMLNELEKEN